ncbi:MAG: hypothetical protein JXA06_00235 [Bacteroidetes bacterium]|nr:hypothetical protein [Bacteroidota bacterium]
MSTIITLYQLFGFPIGVAITIVVGLYFIKHPEKLEKWGSIIASLVSKVIKNVDYYATKLEIQSCVNSYVTSLEDTTTTHFPRISIRWTARGKDEIVWEEGNAIIVMHDRNHHNKNLIHAAYLFTSEALLKKSERHLSKAQKTSLDMFSTKLILGKENKAAVEQFMREYVVPAIDRNDVIRGFIHQYVHIERMGVFFPILIQELTYLGSKVFLSKPSREVIDEVKSIVNFLENFSQREVGDTNTVDTFVGKYMRCAIRIVASKTVRERGNITWHKERVNQVVKNNLENIYLIGSSESKNRRFMDDVTNTCLADNTGLQKVRDYKFKGQIKIGGKMHNVSTYLIHLHNPSAVKYLYEDNDINLETE